MTTTTNDSIRGSGTGTLTALRALAVEPSASIADAIQAAEAQAQLLRDLFPTWESKVALAHLVDLIPNVFVEHVDDIPIPGISFWGNDSWHIHVRVSDPVDFQIFTALHQLKHIIDHPQRRRQTSRSEADWEALANHFARHVLVIESVRVVRLQDGGAYE